MGYFDTAQNFAAGRGLVQTRPSGRLEPSYLQPPFYPMVLAPAALFRLDIVRFSRFLEVVLYAGLIFLTGFYTFRVAHSPQLALLSTSVLLVNMAMLNNYSGAMSEGLYFFLGFLSIFLFIYHTQKPGSWIVLLSGIAASLAFLTRFAGLAFVIVGVVGYLLFDNGRLTKRLINILSGSCFLLPLWQFCYSLTYFGFRSRICMTVFSLSNTNRAPTVPPGLV